MFEIAFRIEIKIKDRYLCFKLRVISSEERLDLSTQCSFVIHKGTEWLYQWGMELISLSLSNPHPLTLSRRRGPGWRDVRRRSWQRSGPCWGSARARSWKILSWRWVMSSHLDFDELTQKCNWLQKGAMIQRYRYIALKCALQIITFTFRDL